MIFEIYTPENPMSTVESKFLALFSKFIKWCDRTFAYELHANLPHVLRLALHLENQQQVYFPEQAELDDALSRQRHNTLTCGLLQTRDSITLGRLHILISRMSCMG